MTIEELLYWGICHRPPKKKDKIEKRKEMMDLVNSVGLHTITDENNKKVAEWYNTTQSEGIVVSFMTLDPSKCKTILNIILKELGLDVKGEEE